jgi:hypothetical protein
MLYFVVGDIHDGTLNSCRHKVQERISYNHRLEVEKEIHVILAETTFMKLARELLFYLGIRGLFKMFPK